MSLPHVKCVAQSHSPSLEEVDTSLGQLPRVRHRRMSALTSQLTFSSSKTRQGQACPQDAPPPPLVRGSHEHQLPVISHPHQRVGWSVRPAGDEWHTIQDVSLITPSPLRHRAGHGPSKSTLECKLARIGASTHRQNGEMDVTERPRSPPWVWTSPMRYHNGRVQWESGLRAAHRLLVQLSAGYALEPRSYRRRHVRYACHIPTPPSWNEWDYQTIRSGHFDSHAPYRPLPSLPLHRRTPHSITRPDKQHGTRALRAQDSRQSRPVQVRGRAEGSAQSLAVSVMDRG